MINAEFTPATIRKSDSIQQNGFTLLWVATRIEKQIMIKSMKGQHEHQMHLPIGFSKVNSEFIEKELSTAGYSVTLDHERRSLKITW